VVIVIDCDSTYLRVTLQSNDAASVPHTYAAAATAADTMLLLQLLLLLMMIVLLLLLLTASHHTTVGFTADGTLKLMDFGLVKRVQRTTLDPSTRCYYNMTGQVGPVSALR
jgi:hypothetical protein